MAEDYHGSFSGIVNSYSHELSLLSTANNVTEYFVSVPMVPGKNETDLRRDCAEIARVIEREGTFSGAFLVLDRGSRCERPHMHGIVRSLRTEEELRLVISKTVGILWGFDRSRNSATRKVIMNSFEVDGVYVGPRLGSHASAIGYALKPFPDGSDPHPSFRTFTAGALAAPWERVLAQAGRGSHPNPPHGRQAPPGASRPPPAFPTHCGWCWHDLASVKNRRKAYVLRTDARYCNNTCATKAQQHRKRIRNRDFCR